MAADLGYAGRTKPVIWPRSIRLSYPSAMLPDAMPLREALRGLRHVLRKGGETLKDTMQVDSLPPPAAHLAGIVLREVEAMAKGMDDAASGLAKKVLSSPDIATPSLHTITEQTGGDIAFAAAFYAASQAVLKRLGAVGIFISEASARKAFQQRAVQGAADAEVAARLTIALHDAKVLRGIAAEPARVAALALEPVTLFAVMLWLQSHRPESEDEAALDAATDLSVALAADISKACIARNPLDLAALYTEFSSHV